MFVTLLDFVNMYERTNETKHGHKERVIFDELAARWSHKISDA